MRARINGQVMPVVYNGTNIIVVLNPSNPNKDQREIVKKVGNEITFVKSVRGKRKRSKMSKIFKTIKP